MLQGVGTYPFGYVLPYDYTHLLVHGGHVNVLMTFPSHQTTDEQRVFIDFTIDYSLVEKTVLFQENCVFKSERYVSFDQVV